MPAPTDPLMRPRASTCSPRSRVTDRRIEMVDIGLPRAPGRRGRGLGDPGRIATWSAMALFAAYAVFHLAGWGTDFLRTAVTDVLYLPLGLAAIALGIRAARAMAGQARRAWWFITAAFAAGLLGNAVWLWLDVVRQDI